MTSETNPTSARTIAQQLAAYFTSADFLAQDVTPIMPYVLDTLAMALGGATSASSVVAREALHHGTGRASIYGTPLSASAADAALINGTAAHALELDDDHRTSVMHPGAVVVPAAFALAQETGADGRLFLLAVLAGYEVCIRAGIAYDGGLYRNGFHPTAVCGVFGAAAAAAVLLKLDADGFTRALAIAGTQAAGLIEWRADGSWIKRLHAGRSGQSGILAAQLARAGFTGPATIFEGEFGVFKALGHGAPVRAAALTQDLGRNFEAYATAIKPYPCCRFSHGAIDLALEAAGQIVVQDILRIELQLFRTDVLTYHKATRNAVDAQFNIPYLVACALHQGHIGLSDFTPLAVLRADILALAAKVDVVERSDYTARYPDTYLTDLIVETGAGRKVWHNACPSGDPAAPAYQRDPDLLAREAIAKTQAILHECGFGACADPLIAAVFALDRAPDLQAVAAGLVAQAQSAAA